MLENKDTGSQYVRKKHSDYIQIHKRIGAGLCFKALEGNLILLETFFFLH